MEFLTTLWIPILASAVIVFFASFITHMVLPLHKGEFKKLPNEETMHPEIAKVPPGLYSLICPESPKDMNSPEFAEKCKKGPNGILVVWDGPVNMGQNLGLTFLFYIVVGIFVAFIGWSSFGKETTEYMVRFRMCAAIAFACHGLGWMSMFIWYRYGKFWPNFIDSLVYALLTAGTFAWLWPTG
ncbi:MAG: hypothetical protein ABL962_10205 [Fimbriimonadaceae bacterium]